MPTHLTEQNMALLTLKLVVKLCSSWLPRKKADANFLTQENVNSTGKPNSENKGRG